MAPQCCPSNTSIPKSSNSHECTTNASSTPVESAPNSDNLNQECCTCENPKLCYVNIQGLIKNQNNKCKINFLCELCKNIKIIILTETHLKADILDEEIQIPDFNIHRCDRRADRKCGGVAIYTHNSLQVNESSVHTFSNSVCELLAIELVEPNLHILCLYRPPDTSGDEFQECLSEVKNYMDQIPTGDDVLLIGDFNFPFLKWQEIDNVVIHQTKSGSTRDEQKQANSLLDITENFYMSQVISEPTRINNTIDLAFTNSKDILSNIKVDRSSNKLSDHNIITADIPYNLNQTAAPENNRKDCKLAEFCFWSDKANWEEVINHLNSIPWEEKLTKDTSVTSDIEFLYEEIYTSCLNYIPVKKPGKPSQIPRDRRILFRRSKFLKKRLINEQNDKKVEKINSELIDIQSRLLDSHKAERVKHEASVIKDIKKNSKVFFKYAKKFRKNKQSIVSLKNEDGISVKQAKAMCEILKKQYEKSFSKKKHTPEINLTAPSDENTMNINDLFSGVAPFTEIEITNEDVLSAIKATKLNSAPGPDGLPPIFLHKCASPLLNPLKIIMKKSLLNSDIPHNWKEAVITPIYKGKGEKSDPAVYRPISLTNIIIKLLERIIRSYIIQYLEANDAFPHSQHGFRPNRSTVSQLLEQYDAILDALCTQSNIDIILLDYAKAFDKINHSILLEKVQKLGIGGLIGKWIGHFLLNRTQKVSLCGHLSNSSKVASGVPQGTILGPVLFLIYIADIGDNVTKSTISSYADDSKAHKKIININDGSDLQLDVNTLYNWTEKNLMEFNSAKFEALRIGKNEVLKEEIQYKTPEGKNIVATETVKDLGVYFNSKGTFADHIKIKAAKGKQMTGYILRTFLSRDRDILLTLLKSLVYPILDYSCVVWNPYLQQDITLLESPQRKLTSQIHGMESLDYYKRLKELNLYSAERRRDRYLLIYIFKILHNKVPNPGISYKYSPRRGKVLITPPVRSSKSCHATTLMHNSFMYRASRIFNAIPKEIRKLGVETSLDSIKHKIDRFLQHITDEPRLPGYLPSVSTASNKLEDQIRATEFLNEGHR